MQSVSLCILGLTTASGLVMAPLAAQRASTSAPQMLADGEAMGRRAALASLFVAAVPAAANAMIVREHLRLDPAPSHAVRSWLGAC